MKRNGTDYIVVHASATPPDMQIGAADIDNWHKSNGWSGIGYHAVIRRNGTLEFGRHFDDIGAHVRGHNSKSVGVCLAGGVDENNQPDNNFTPEQFRTLRKVLEMLECAYPGAIIVGHRDLYEYKDCPCFDVADWWLNVPGPTE